MMERKHLHGITLLGGLAMALLCGCIRDELEPCPPLRLSLEVADKNYVNSAAAARLGYEEERPEDLPFREYVSDLAYRVSDLETAVSWPSARCHPWKATREAWRCPYRPTFPTALTC